MRMTTARGPGRRRPTPLVSSIVVGVVVGVVAWAVPGGAGRAAAAPAGQSGHETSALPRNPGEGGRVFIAKGCIRCHAIHGEGGNLGPDLGRSTTGLNLPELAASMWNHTPSMGRQLGLLSLERPKFERGEMRAITAFLYFLNFAHPDDGNAARGAALFASKGCDRCHEIGGRGGIIGPPLDEMGGSLSPVIVTQRMWNHGPVMIELSRDMGLRVPVLSSQEMEDLVAYLRASSVAPLEGASFQRPGDAARGEALFAAKGCAACHGTSSSRRRSNAPDLGNSRLGVGVLELAARLWNHMPQMYDQMERAALAPPELTETEMTDVLAYLYSLDYGGGQPDLRRGEVLLESKGCRSCHSLVASGSGDAPSLGESRATRSLEEGVRLLWNHGPAMLSKMRETGSQWPRLDGDEIRDILGYLRSLGDA